MDFFRRVRNMYYGDCPNDSMPQEEGNGTFLIDEKSASPMAIIYRSELDYISRCVLDYPNIETGGQLFGFWTNQGVPVVLYAIGPGYNANHQPTFFNQDTGYLSEVGNALLDKYALQHIGEWHSHHQLGLARPSGHDAQTMYHGLQNIPARHLLLCICNYENGRSVINPFTFHENSINRYVDAYWKIKELDSPFRAIADNELRHILIHPRTSEAAHGQLRLIENIRRPAPTAESSIRFDKDYWLLRQGNIENMKKMTACVQEYFPEQNVKVQSDDNGIVQITIDDNGSAIVFPAMFPSEPPKVVGNIIGDNPPQWISPSDERQLPDLFRSWISSCVNKG